jgi:hypothetical protein
MVKINTCWEQESFGLGLFQNRETLTLENSELA